MRNNTDNTYSVISDRISYLTVISSMIPSLSNSVRRNTDKVHFDRNFFNVFIKKNMVNLLPPTGGNTSGRIPRRG